MKSKEVTNRDFKGGHFEAPVQHLYKYKKDQTTRCFCFVLENELGRRTHRPRWARHAPPKVWLEVELGDATSSGSKALHPSSLPKSQLFGYKLLT